MFTTAILVAAIALGVWALIHIWRRESLYARQVHQAKIQAWNEGHDYMWDPEVHPKGTWEQNPYFTEDHGR